ncbi:MAG: hypothetical protein ACRDGD_02105 [Candidatus Limnocylindria bacterium]
MLDQVARWLGLLIHVPMIFVFVVQGLVLPSEGVAFLVGFWVLLLIGIGALWRRAPLVIAAVPIVDVILIYAVTAVGREMFDWRV